MYGANRFIILSLITTIVVANAQDSNIVFPADFKEEDITPLKSTTSRQVLPITLFEREAAHLQLIIPFGLVQAEINDGRLASGTEFYTLSSFKSKQLFFCPSSNPQDISEPEHNEKCLVPTKFEKSQVLECEFEPEPVIYTRPDIQKCGPDGIGTFLVMVYRVCPAQPPYTYTTTSITMYSLCYDKSSKKVLFVSHKTVMADLLTENLLAKEREIKFETLSTSTNSLINENYHTVVNEAVKRKPQYEFQKLVYPDNYPFAIMRKGAYHYANIALQHKELVGLWNQINADIKINVMEMHNFPRVIRTGLIDIPKVQISSEKKDDIPDVSEVRISFEDKHDIPDVQISSEDKDDQIYNIWCTMVMDVNREPNKGIAILVNNFFTQDEKLRNFIDDLCEEEDYCVKSLKDKFDQIGGRVRCCRVTERISKYFLLEDNITSIGEILKIRNITYVMRNGKTIVGDK